MGPPLRSFAADAHDCIMVRVLGPTEYKVAARLNPRPVSGLPSDRHRDRISVPSCSKLSMVWPGKGEACRKVGVTANLVQILRASTSAMRRSGRKKRALRSNQETDEGKLRRPGQLLDKENPIQGPWCRFRREARARERLRHRGG